MRDGSHILFVLHHLKKTLYIITIISIFIACSTEPKREVQEKLEPFEITNRISSKTYGDTLRVEYEYRGDTVIQKRIDSKGTTDDNFDSSFTVTSIWSTKNTSKLLCDEKLKLTLDDIDYEFCYQDVLKQFDKEIALSKAKNNIWDADGLLEMKMDVMKYHNGKNIDLDFFGNSYLMDLVKEINVNIYDNKTKSLIEQISLEKYETNFSEGKKYYFLNKKKDTIAVYRRLEWMS
ncbi:hypothetical protein LY01_01682 [Nonlabens xylanidelens]|uniref:Lipoprotein n=1 Tax=Nonlabens xylanidelens TaxID=191564 RepID=A0A2S6IL38_9FLAO|nr:hypothetical protein [Nonlabens xylanidelens]PPK94929.1 hypothetical protein LY01_01682 [Nonlabens xylanidelens]PQJ17477.1 hypothetical protein BST94_10480 [Nonlabens xylanidelens]